MSVFKLSETSKKRRRGARPELIEISNRAIQITQVDFGHPEYAGGRTISDQQHLYSIGASRADGVLKKSDHQVDDVKIFSDALDFYAYVNGRATWNEGDLAQVACSFFQAASELGYRIEWGGLWTDFKDYPHIKFIGSY